MQDSVILIVIAIPITFPVAIPTRPQRASEAPNSENRTRIKFASSTITGISRNF